MYPDQSTELTKTGTNSAESPGQHTAEILRALGDLKPRHPVAEIILAAGQAIASVVTSFRAQKHE